jgi:anti-anti-sigma regulatory factor
MPAFTVDERDDYAVIVFPEFGDAMRTRAEEKQLLELVKRKAVVVVDLTSCRMLDTPWLRLITTLSTQADGFGRRVAVAGASDEMKKSTDLIGQRKHLHLFPTVKDAIADHGEEAK